MNHCGNRRNDDLPGDPVDAEPRPYWEEVMAGAGCLGARVTPMHDPFLKGIYSTTPADVIFRDQVADQVASPLLELPMNPSPFFDQLRLTQQMLLEGRVRDVPAGRAFDALVKAVGIDAVAQALYALDFRLLYLRACGLAPDLSEQDRRAIRRGRPLPLPLYWGEFDGFVLPYVLAPEKRAPGHLTRWVPVNLRLEAFGLTEPAARKHRRYLAHEKAKFRVAIGRRTERVSCLPLEAMVLDVHTLARCPHLLVPLAREPMAALDEEMTATLRSLLRWWFGPFAESEESGQGRASTHQPGTAQGALN